LIRLHWLLCLVLVLSLVGLTACSKSTSSSSNAHSILYLATESDSQLISYSIDANTGALSTTGSGAPTGTNPTAMVVSPSGDALFMVNSGSNDLYAYTVGSDGSTSASGSPIAFPQAPSALAMNSTGTYLFVATPGIIAQTSVPGSITVFSVSGASLTQVGQPLQSTANGIGPVGLALSPSGNTLYAANSTDGVVAEYAVDGTGTLTDLNISYPVGISPAGMAAAKYGTTDFLYVANAGSNNVSVFTICTAISSQCQSADDSLVAATGSPFSAGVRPIAIVPHPLLNFLYVLDTQSNQVSGYRVSTGTGALTPLTPATYSTGTTPVSITIEPAGNYLFVANIGSANISGFHIDQTTGQLGPLPQVTTPSQPSALASQ
jgi:6-phosphogluconolactonase